MELAHHLDAALLVDAAQGTLHVALRQPLQLGGRQGGADVNVSRHCQ